VDRVGFARAKRGGKTAISTTLFISLASGKNGIDDNSSKIELEKDHVIPNLQSVFTDVYFLLWHMTLRGINHQTLHTDNLSSLARLVHL
jgi:hypothetical protein